MTSVDISTKLIASRHIRWCDQVYRLYLERVLRHGDVVVFVAAAVVVLKPRHQSAQSLEESSTNRDDLQEKMNENKHS
jgi:hypothetical protein